MVEIMDHFTEALEFSRYTIYRQVYGGPVGFRVALAHPERIKTCPFVRTAGVSPEHAPPA
jgi:hypothetical protein